MYYRRIRLILNCEFFQTIGFYWKARAEILPIAIAYLALSRNQFNHVFALLIIPRFKSINFYQNRPKIRLLLQKKLQNFGVLEASPPYPRTQSFHCRVAMCLTSRQYYSNANFLHQNFPSITSTKKKLHEKSNTVLKIKLKVL